MSYTMQTFLDTSRRRAREARALLDVPKRACDGAATCALLAAECALKATLLYGRQATTLDDISEEIQTKAFRGRAGHDLAVLWNLQDTSVRAHGTDEQFEARDHLKRLDRFLHRYGVKRPERQHAEKAVRSAEKIVEWMKAIVT